MLSFWETLWQEETRQWQSESEYWQQELVRRQQEPEMDLKPQLSHRAFAEASVLEVEEKRELEDVDLDWGLGVVAGMVVGMVEIVVARPHLVVGYGPAGLTEMAFLASQQGEP
jgi:hypothetical protein